MTQKTHEHATLAAALAAFQGEVKNPEKTKTADAGKYNYKYADIGDVLEAVLPLLSAHGLSLTQPTEITDGAIVLVTRITHTSGDSIESRYPVCSLNGNHQAMGSAMTYARRYALTSLIGIAAVEDTDGQGAAEVGEGPRKKMTAAAAKDELNWSEIQNSIDGAKDFKALDRREQVVEDRKGVWPDTYYWKAKERIEFNRLAMAEAKLNAAKDIDALNDIYEQLDGILDGKVSADELIGLHRRRESQIMNSAEPDLSQHPLTAG